jgi:hypothetical protein
MSGFWQESASEQFGAYGWLGNSYGEPRIELRPSRGQRPKRTQVYAVGENDYLSFKQRQMRLAVEATKAALAIWRWKI